MKMGSDMAKLEKIYFLENSGIFKKLNSIRIRWDNHRFQEITIAGDQPEDLVAALYEAAKLLEAEIANKQI